MRLPETCIEQASKHKENIPTEVSNAQLKYL